MKNGLRVVLPIALCMSATTWAATYTVGPGQTYTTIGAVPALAAGDVVEVFPGTYHEVKRWTNAGASGNPITIRGMGTPQPVIDANGFTVDGALPNPRAAFQVEASYVVIENFELINARNGDNGAGIRVTTFGTTTNGVVIRNCKIDNNDMGIMCDGSDNLLIDSCEIATNGTPLYDGFSHNLYLGGNKTTLQYCYIHDSTNGQNFKTRGHYTELLYNYIADSQDGELGLVDDPTNTTSANSNAVMIGNIVVSKPRLSGYNSGRFIQFGQDLGSAHNGVLYAINNTFAAGDSKINFLDANATGASIVASNNVFFNSQTLSTGGPVSGSNNWVPTGSAIPAGFSGTVTGASPGFVNAATRNFHLTASSPCVDIAVAAPTYLDGSGVSHSAVPTQEYVQQLLSTPRVADAKLDDGAYEFNPVNAAPQILSGPQALPNPATVGQSVTFSISAVDVDGDGLTYAWNFGDGTTGAGSSATHSFAAAGVFAATVTVSDPGGLTATGSVSVTVNASGGGGGGGGGSGGGGGGGTGGGTTQLLTVKKLQGNAKFAAGGHDTCSISGVLPNLPAGFSPATQTFVLNVGGATATFTLDAKGRGKTATGNLTLKLKLVRDKTTKKSTFKGGDGPFSAHLKSGTWATVWNMNQTVSSSKTPTPMLISVQLAGVTYAVTATVLYTVKAHVGGKITK